MNNAPFASSIKREPAHASKCTEQPMNIRELVEMLGGFDPELRVVVASPNSGCRDVTTLAKVGLIIAPDDASDHELAEDEEEVEEVACLVSAT